jgi:tRNA(fMet)-specific endonuclease VapC
MESCLIVSSARFLLDSNICIYILKGLSESARRAVEDHAPGEVVTSAVAYAEVMNGLRDADSKALAHAAAFFRTVPVQPFDAAAAEKYRSLVFERHRFDHLIAAHALSLDLVMVTRNARHFRNVPALRVEDWTFR